MSGFDEAVYIQQLAGAGVGINAVTGRVDVGGVAWLFRDGQVAGRLDVLPIASDLLSILAAVLAVGDDAQPAPFSPAIASTVLCDSRLMANNS